MEIGRLENLKFLSVDSFIVSKCSGSKIEDLGKLCNLDGEFTISGLENVANGKSAWTANMKGKKYIKKLTLKWCSDVDNSQLVHDVLENLRPHLEIKCVEIDKYPGTYFSDWLGDASFCKMTSLCLSNCENCFCLPAIGQLPSLEYLRICGLSKVLNIGEEFYGNIEPFPCLKELRIENMHEWREWHIPENGVFSYLEKLHIANCPQLIGEFPKQLLSLRTLVISGCPGLVGADGGLTIFYSKADSFPQFCSLRDLSISGMPNLKELSSSDLNQLLPGLEKLSIADCQQIVHLSINCLPTTLKQLSILKCGNLDLVL